MIFLLVDQSMKLFVFFKLFNILINMVKFARPVGVRVRTQSFQIPKRNWNISVKIMKQKRTKRNDPPVTWFLFYFSLRFVCLFVCFIWEVFLVVRKVTIKTTMLFYLMDFFRSNVCWHLIKIEIQTTCYLKVQDAMLVGLKCWFLNKWIIGIRSLYLFSNEWTYLIKTLWNHCLILIRNSIDK